MKRWWGYGLALLVISALLVGGFYVTGGRGLIRIIPSYLLADIPDKRYGWSDFLPSGTQRKVSGFYSATLSNENRLAIWTLAGLQTFTHNPGRSVYYHRDTCGVIKAMKEGDGGEALNPMAVYVDPASWRAVMQQEYLVTVQWEEGSRNVENVWSISGKYRVLGKVEGGVCD